jgi:hypothetical protein
MLIRMAKKPTSDPSEIHDEPGMSERFQRALRNLINTPPQHRSASTPKAKERPVSKGRVHKGKTRSYVKKPARLQDEGDLPRSG